MDTFVCMSGLSQRANQGILVGLLLGSGIGWGSAAFALSPQPITSSHGVAIEHSRPFSIAQASDAVVPGNFQQILFVNPMLGSDETGEGTMRSPFRSITYAVQFAQPNTVIMLAGGTYSQRSGEQFPIGLPPGVRLMEMPNGTVTIQGEIVEGQAVAAAPAAPPRVTPEAPAVVLPQPLALPSPTVEPVAASFAPPIEIPVIPVSEPAAIALPVEPSALESVLSDSSSVVSQGQRPTSDSPIEIPVPPPDNPVPVAVGRSQPLVQSAARPAQPVVQQAVRPQVNVVLPSAAPVTNPNLLPVPDFDIPLGYVGDRPTVSASAFGAPSAGAPVPAVPTRTAARSPDPSLRYRVLVRLENEALRGWVQSVVPEAFETTVDGQPVMQVGAFQTIDNAEAAAEQLNQSGVRAIIQEF